MQVHDFGEEGDVAYLVMEFVKGRDLKSFFDKNERFDLREAVRVMCELCDALDFAHRGGIIHRDVKPGNVMLDPEMRAKLTDFGVARVQDPGASPMTQAGTMVGTPAYMSPEQITGRPADARSDVFSAGIILYQFLTGEMPFTGAGAWTIAKKIMQDEPALPSMIDTAISPLFDAVVARALAKQPEQRYQSARLLGAALRQALEGKSADEAATVVQAPGKPRAAAAATSVHDADVEFWRSIKDGAEARGFELYLEQFPNGIYAKLAQHKLSSLRGAPQAAEPGEKVPPSHERTAKRRPALVAPLLIGVAVVVLGAGAWFAWKQTPPDGPIAKTAGDAGKAVAEERAAAGKLAAAKAADEKAQAEKAAAEQAAAEKAAKEKQLSEKQAAEKAAQEKAEAARFAAVKAVAEKQLADRAAAEKKASEKARLVKVAEEKAAEEANARAAAEKAAEQARLAKVAEEKLASIQSAVPAPAARPGRSFRDCDVCPEMVMIPAGSFTMGSPDSEPMRAFYEGPQHQVTISRSFAAGRYEVTFDEWDACVREGGCSHNPSDAGGGRGRRPVFQVSWNDAKEYVAWLSRKTGKTYRLLSEAEWEYVARAGTTTAFSFGASVSPQQANYSYAGSPTGAKQGKKVAVGSYAPNAFGLYDLHGNVREWVEDCWNEDYTGAPGDGSARTSGNCGRRVLRGGSWNDDPRSLRSASRAN